MFVPNVKFFPLLLLFLSVLEIKSEDYEEHETRLYGGGNAQSDTIFTRSTVNILTGNDAGSAKHLCQGVLIAANMTITAASCLYDINTNQFLPKENIFLRVGSLDRAVVTNPTPVAVNRVIIYPRFHYFPNGKRFMEDLALIVPASNFPINGIRLGKHTGNLTVQITSWGDKVQLQQISAGITNLEACKQFYATAALPMEVDATTLCLNDVNNRNTVAGICEKDAGAGVYMYEKRSKDYVLVAIASRQFVCPPTWPSVVSRVATASKWILENGGPKLIYQ